MKDIESNAKFECEVVDCGDKCPFDVSISYISPTQQTSGNSDTFTEAHINVFVVFPQWLNAIETTFYDLSIQCKDEFDLLTPLLPMKSNVIDTRAPQIQWISRPALVTIDSNAQFSFKVLDGDSDCVGCKFQCSLDGLVVNSCSKDMTLSNIDYGRHELQITASDMSNNSDIQTAEWHRLDVVISPMTRWSEGKTQEVFTPGVHKLEVTEFGEYPDMVAKLDVSHNYSVDLGLKLSSALYPLEVVTITCQNKGGEVDLSRKTLVYQGSTEINWLTITGNDSHDNQVDAIPFSISCSIKSTADDHYGLLPDMTFEGTKQSVIWPIFEDIFLHQQTAIGSNKTELISSVVDDKFSLSVAGSEIISIIPGRNYTENNHPAFLDSIEIYLDDTLLSPLCEDFKGKECIVLLNNKNVTIDVPENGITLRLPSYDETCGSSGNLCAGDKAYRSLTLKNKFQLSDDANSPYAEALGGVVSCSPYCNGGNEGQGLYFSWACEGYATGPQCRDVAYSQANCAVRMDGFCTDCPSGSICPGGSRIWPQPGFWSINAYTLPQPCDEPAEVRCGGWDESTGEPTCGSLYTGPYCKSCVTGYYPGFNGLECLECPHPSLLTYALPLLKIAFLASLLFGMMFAVVWYASKTRGGTLSSGAKRTLTFVIWAVMGLQTIIQVGRSSKSHLPPSLQSFYTTLNVFQFELEIIHPNCMGDDPVFIDKCIMLLAFTLHFLLFGIGIFLYFFSPKLVDIASGKTKKISRIFVTLMNFERSLFLLSALIYPVLCNTSVKFLDCIDVAGDMRLRDNPVLVCYEGDILFLNIGAMAMMVIILIGMPIFTFFRLRYLLNRVATQSNGDSKVTVDDIFYSKNFKKPTGWAYHLSNDFKASKFYFRHISKYTLLFITLAMSFGISPYVTCGIDCFVFVFGIVWYLKDRPFVPMEQWKNPVKVCILLLSALAAVFNAVIHSGSFDDAVLNVLAYLLLAASGLVMLSLVVSFVFVLFSGAKNDALVEERRRKKKFKKFQLRHQQMMGNKGNFDKMNVGIFDDKDSFVANPMLQDKGSESPTGFGDLTKSFNTNPLAQRPSKNVLSLKQRTHNPSNVGGRGRNRNRRRNNRASVAESSYHHQQNQQRNKSISREQIRVGQASAMRLRSRFSKNDLNAPERVSLGTKSLQSTVGSPILISPSSSLSNSSVPHLNQQNGWNDDDDDTVKGSITFTKELEAGRFGFYVEEM
eukprot:TRINITY_DN583_c0_g2_i2.p1 TRINITY_DN583_c0_g2~~TRINITY_DN583_c0_g2_i2.p1  ORF type:complete len:1219 (-),score=282.24 TRINITY_DN583_c0_g2_i2:1178-4834(-)